MKFIGYILIIFMALPLAGASDLSVLVVDKDNNPIPNAIVSYQNNAVETDANGRGIMNGIPTNTTWSFTVSADGYNIQTESFQLTSNDSSKTFIITKKPPATTSPAPLPDINIRIHVTDTKSAAISLAAVNALGKLRYTNIYGDVDFIVPKGTESVEVAISKKDYSSVTKTYIIPEELENDDFRVEVQLTPVNPETPPIIDVTRIEASAIKPTGWGLTLFLLGLILTFYPEKKAKK